MVLNAATVVALNDEGHALLEFSSRTHGSRGALSDWNAEHSTPCQWTGITCSEDLRIVVINLTGKRLEGNLTVDITRFSLLQALNVSSNAFSGELPSSFGDSPNLQILNLHSNHLTGVIPASLSRLSSLTNLDLSNNRLDVHWMLRLNLPISLA